MWICTSQKSEKYDLNIFSWDKTKLFFNKKLVVIENQENKVWTQYIRYSQAKKSKVCQHFLLAFIIIRLIVESRLSGFLRKFNEFSKAHYHNLFFGLLLLKGSQYGRKFKSLSKNISSNNCRNYYSFLKMKYWDLAFGKIGV